jgi:O-antigen ligase
VAAFALPVGSFGEPKVFLLVLMLLLIFILLWLGRKDGRALPDFPWGPAWLVLVVLIWAGASFWWSLDPAHTLKKLIDLALVGIGALLLFGAERRLSPRDLNVFGLALAGGLAVFFILQWIEILTGGAIVGLVHGLREGSTQEPLSKLVRGISVATLLTWSAMVYFHRAARPGLGLALGLAALGTLWATTASAAALSASLGAVVCLVLVRLPVGAVRWAAGLAALWVLAAPLVLGAATKAIDSGRTSQNQANPSVAHRLVIWRFASDKIMERPLLGYGLRASRVIPGGSEKVLLGGKTLRFERDRFSVHPHNGPLEWWLELGLPGAALGALVVFLLFRWPQRFADPVLRALLVGQLTTAYGILNLSFGVWQTWWLMALVLAAFVAAVVLDGAGRMGADHSASP